MKAKAPTRLDVKTALAKAQHWCAYQERAQQEMRDKLYEWQLNTSEVELIIAELIAHNYLNEERFALSYASGKFNIKKWGKLKIKQGLRLKRVPEKLIQKALNSIDDDTYYTVLCNLYEKKQLLEKEKNPTKRRFKLSNYLKSKGFEDHLIFNLLKPS